MTTGSVSRGKSDELTSDAIKLIRFVDSLLLVCGQPRKPIRVGIVPQRRRHGSVTVLNKPSSGCCAAWRRKMHGGTGPIGN